MTLTHKPPNVGQLDTYELQMLREMLLQQREFRIEQLDRLRLDAVRTRPRTPADVEVERSLRSGARCALREVEGALNRMRTGTFGRCVRCASTLPLERLEILPHAALCMACQRSREDAG
jgi:DnaK suppressor protein